MHSNHTTLDCPRNIPQWTQLGIPYPTGAHMECCLGDSQLKQTTIGSKNWIMKTIHGTIIKLDCVGMFCK